MRNYVRNDEDKFGRCRELYRDVGRKFKEATVGDNPDYEAAFRLNRQSQLLAVLMQVYLLRAGARVGENPLLGSAYSEYQLQVNLLNVLNERTGGVDGKPKTPRFQPNA